MRIDKLISSYLNVSRKEAINIIKKKQVLVNKKEITKHDINVDEINDEIIVSNQIIKYNNFIYLMLNKPAGFLSATFDNKQKTIMDLIGNVPNKKDLAPVGRLDIDTEGLQLITNDGILSHILRSPKHHVDKMYYALLLQPISDEDKLLLEQGVDIGDYQTDKATIKKINDLEIYITIHEGKFHQIKRMFEKVNNKVIYLKRLTFASLVLDENLKLGEYRYLNEDEIRKLKEYE